MTQEAEFAQIVRQLPPESLKEIKKVLEALFDQQKAAEAKKYESLRITPFEAVKISRIGECDIALLAAFGLDCLRYNKAKKSVSHSLVRSIRFVQVESITVLKTPARLCH